MYEMKIHYMRLMIHWSPWRGNEDIEKIFESIMAKMFPNLMNIISPQIEEAQ